MDMGEMGQVPDLQSSVRGHGRIGRHHETSRRTWPNAPSELADLLPGAGRGCRPAERIKAAGGKILNGPMDVAVR
jgi:hypothetical protein